MDELQTTFGEAPSISDESHQKALQYLRHHMLWDQDERLSAVKVKKDGSLELKDTFENPYMR